MDWKTGEITQQPIGMNDQMLSLSVLFHATPVALCETNFEGQGPLQLQGQLE